MKGRGLMVYIELLQADLCSDMLCYNDVFQPATATEEQKNMYKTVSTGELGKSDARKISHGDGRCLL